MKAEINVLYQDSSAIIFESTLRGYPSLAIQGDKLGLLASHSARVIAALDRLEISDEELESVEYVQSLITHLDNLYRKYGFKE